MDNLRTKPRRELSAEDWAELKVLFSRVLELEGGNRSEILNACPPYLRSTLEDLLRSHSEQLSVPTRSFISNKRLLEYLSVGLRTFAIGDVVCNRFRVERFIGQGGMGEVYAVTDLELGEMAAIKTIRPLISSVPRMLSYFRQEIHLARKVTHLNVCRTYDLFQHQLEDGKSIWGLSMEYLEGPTLRARLQQQGPFQISTALRIVEQISEALDAAHNVGVIHRDLKSSNIILVTQPEGTTRAVVTDFGLAIDQFTSTEKDFGEIAGTPAYMAPEQLTGGHVTPAADIYALGVVIHEMLTGTFPVRVAAPSGSLSTVSEVRKSSVSDSFPKEASNWEETIIRCLDLDPTMRPQRARFVFESLQSPRTVDRRWLIGSLFAAITSGVIFFESRFRHPTSALHRSSPTLKKAQEFAKRRTQEGLENAILEYREALKSEPNNVDAWVGLADAYSAMANFQFMDIKSGFQAARDAAQQALRLDPTSGRAHGVLAYCESNDLKEWRRAEPHFREAIRLSPNDPQVRLWYGAHLGKLGRTTEGIEQLKVGLQEDPASLSLNQQLATEYFLSGQIANFERQARELVRLQPFEATSYLMLARSLEEEGHYTEALESCQKAETYHYSIAALCIRGSIEAGRGNKKIAQEIAVKVEEYWKKNPFESLLLAALYCRLDKCSHAMDILLAGCDRDDSSVLLAPQHPHLKGLKADARYPSFLARIGFEGPNA